MQVVKGYSPTKTGVAFLPMTAAVLLSAGGLSTRLLPKLPPRALIVPGMLIASCGMLWILTLETGTPYARGVLVTQLLLGFGAGMIMPTALNYAIHGVDPSDSGVASAGVNTAQQIGASIGTALLNTIATSTTADYLDSHSPSPVVAKQAAVEGFAAAGAWAAGIMLVGALIVAVLMNTSRPSHQTVAENAENAENAEDAEDAKDAKDAETLEPLPAHS